MNKSVFISHASEDKDRFVRDFAAKLRERGIGKAHAVIVVISSLSVQKPWVRAELNTSVMNKIEGKIKLIPVIIDDCRIPEALRDILHVRIMDVNNYAPELDRIVDVLFGIIRKPVLGEAPEYSKSSPIPVGGLRNTDQYVLKTACELSLAVDSDVLTPSAVVSRTEGSGMSERQVRDSIQVLGEEGLLTISGALGVDAVYFRISPRGFDLFCREQIEDYESVVRAVASKILNNNQNSSLRIAETVRQPRLVVNHIMNEFAVQGFCKKSGEIGTNVSVYDISPRFRRAFER